MHTQAIDETWDTDESPTLREVAAYLKGVADAMAGVREPAGRALALAPSLMPLPANAPLSSPRISTRSPSAPVGTITLRFGQANVPFEPILRPRCASGADRRLAASRGGARLLDLDDMAAGGLVLASIPPLRETLPYEVSAISISPLTTVSAVPSQWPINDNERASGVRLRLTSLRPEWFELAGNER